MIVQPQGVHNFVSWDPAKYFALFLNAKSIQSLKLAFCSCNDVSFGGFYAWKNCNDFDNWVT